ncbi:MAG: (Fe-S)-binding protein [Rhodospirillales bacterium]|nr:(Fe-S)-binding protein [Rhodospirillales bacterium]
MKNSPEKPSVALYVTCLVDLTRPGVGFAAVKLLEDAGCVLSVPETQTCCGQPAYNAGDQGDARALALQVIENFSGYDYVVIPSGSCAAMIKDHYPKLFKDDPAMLKRSVDLAQRTWELTAFLRDVMQYSPQNVSCPGSATYHDSCSGLRELNIKDQPRDLLGAVDGLTIVEADLAETCCGFGGLFCVKYPDISSAMADRKIDDIVNTGADTLLGGDLGCLMNLAGRMSRRGEKLKVWHVAEVLAGMTEGTRPISGDKDAK